MRDQIPLCGDCGEVVDPETWGGCKCPDQEDGFFLCVVCKRFYEAGEAVFDSTGDAACEQCSINT